MSTDLQTPLCLFGAGGHGKVVASFVKNQWQGPLCFADSQQTIGIQVADLPVQFQDISQITGHDIIITIGLNILREKLQNQAYKQGLGVATLVAKQAIYLSGQLPKAGTVILAGAVVNVDEQIGKGVIVNTCAIVEHDCLIGDFCHIAPGAVVLGGSHLGTRVWLGANATVLQGVHVAADCIIGAGSVVIHDIIKPGVYVGTPARRVEN